MKHDKSASILVEDIDHLLKYVSWRQDSAKLVLQARDSNNLPFDLPFNAELVVVVTISFIVKSYSSCQGDKEMDNFKTVSELIGGTPWEGIIDEPWDCGIKFFNMSNSAQTSFWNYHYHQ
jgi:hypothetical protein